MPYDNAVAVGSPKGPTDTQMARNEITALQEAISSELSVLADALAPILRSEPSAASDGKNETVHGNSTLIHGWLCAERETLIRHLQILKSLNSRIEV